MPHGVVFKFSVFGTAVSIPDRVLRFLCLDGDSLRCSACLVSIPDRVLRFLCLDLSLSIVITFKAVSIPDRVLRFLCR